MTDYHKTETIRCALFVEADNGLFDRHDVAIEVTPEVAISRVVAFEVEKSKTKTIVFQTNGGRLPVQGQFLLIPYDTGRHVSDIFSYEHKMYPKTMEIEITYPSLAAESLHIQAKFRDSLAKTRLSLAWENNSIVPLYDIKTATIPLRSKVIQWGKEFTQNVLIVRLWNNKIIRTDEVLDDIVKG